MKLLVGLGNPGEDYKNTRHNAGFMVVDRLAEREHANWKHDLLLQSLIAEIKLNGEKIILAKPTTFMNRSGAAIASLLGKFKLTPEDMLVIHDELDFPLGTVKVQIGGSSAGNNGVESIINTLKTENFLRFRLGIGRPEGNIKPEDYVLMKFSTNEQPIVEEVIKKSIGYVEKIQEHGLEQFLSKYYTS